ncbi:hypothetical protein RA276_31505, partial [Pseudomonas syringae pv. tagetis]|uniref:hypothetical protein n=1 Tax=Pseudomonas syringae group genomosp. 7 TaxID=251699 RepID=UPI00376FE6E5
RHEVNAITINEMLAELSSESFQLSFEKSVRCMHAEYSVAQATQNLLNILTQLTRASHIIAGSLEAIRSYEMEIETDHQL